MIVLRTSVNPRSFEAHEISTRYFISYDANTKTVKYWAWARENKRPTHPIEGMMGLELWNSLAES